MSAPRDRECLKSDWPSPELVASLRAELDGRTSEIGLVLGSGLGEIANLLEDSWIRRAEEIPGYPASTAPGHLGRLLLGRFGGRDIFVVQGRAHLYEGYTAEYATRYVRLLHALGVRTLILTNAAGSVRSEDGPGTICLLRDALPLFFRPLAAPLVAPEARGVMRRREPLLDPELADLAAELALESGIPLRSGVLIGSPGPTYETAAEVRMYRQIGGATASMSTVPELLVARELGLRTLAFSLVTNLGTGLAKEKLTGEDVVRTADAVGGPLRRLLEAIVYALRP